MFEKRYLTLLVWIYFFWCNMQGAASDLPNRGKLVSVYVPFFERALTLSPDCFVTEGYLMINQEGRVCETRTGTVIGEFDEKGLLCKKPLWQNMLCAQKVTESTVENLIKWHQLSAKEPRMSTFFALHLKVRYLWYTDIISRKEGGTMHLDEFFDQLILKQLGYIHEIAMFMNTMGWNMSEFYKNLFEREPKSSHWFAYMHEGSYYAYNEDGEYAREVLHRKNRLLIETFPALLVPSVESKAITTVTPTQSSNSCLLQ